VINLALDRADPRPHDWLFYSLITTDARFLAPTIETVAMATVAHKIERVTDVQLIESGFWLFVGVKHCPPPLYNIGSQSHSVNSITLVILLPLVLTCTNELVHLGNSRVGFPYTWRRLQTLLKHHDRVLKCTEVPFQAPFVLWTWTRIDQLILMPLD
jgi:hypothetical protein